MAENLTWHGSKLYLGKRTVGERPCGACSCQIRLTDMFNRTRAKDAALALALATLNRKSDVEETGAEAALVSYFPPHNAGRCP